MYVHCNCGKAVQYKGSKSALSRGVAKVKCPCGKELKIGKKSNGGLFCQAK